MTTEPSERARFASTAKEIIQAHTHETRAAGHADCDACLDADANAVESIVSAQNDAATRMRERCVGVVKAETPGSWLDPLLTGENAVLGQPPYDCADVEIIIGAVSKRIITAIESLTLEAAANSVKDSEGEGVNHG